MLERFTLRLLPALSLALLVAASAVSTAREKPVDVSEALSGTITVGTNVISRIAPGNADGRIAFITGKMLEQVQYDRQPFTDSISSKFLDQYLETLDPQHLHFLESDLAEFEYYRTNLDDLTVERSQGVADTRPAFVIFNRFVERLAQRVEYADEILSNEEFSFDENDRIAVNRRELPYPKDMGEARKLWRERLKFEYLQEKMGRADARKKAEKDPRVGKTPGESLDKPEKPEREQIVDTLSHRYHRNLRTFTDWDNDDVLQIYLTALAHVFDPHSDYFGQEQLDSFSIGMNLSLFGIGAELTSEDGYCTIRRLLAGGPAEKSKKLKEKDQIIAVAQSNQPPVDVVDMSLSKAVQLIRGPKGTEVRLTIIPAGGSSADRQIISLIRDEIKLDDQAAKAKLIELPGNNNKPMRLGVIDLPSFYATFDPGHSRNKAEPRSTSADVAKLLTKLKKEKVDGIILDLRRNGGGSLEEAIRLTGLFIKEGPVVQVRDTDGGIQKDNDEDSSILYSGPLVVLTSRFSASASEILAGALQDYGRALIVGDSSTHGKGTVQSVNYLKPYMNLRQRGPGWTNEPGALKVTIKKFYRASGASTQLKGVVPDIVLPSVMNESKDIGESALDNPMPWDTVPTAEFDRYDMVAPFLAELRKRTTDRIAHDRDFEYIREDIEHFKKMQADKTISLNEEQRLKEKEELEARQKERDKERRSRPELAETVYEITLKQVDLPGLPPPVARTNLTAEASGPRGSAATTNDSASIAGSTSEEPPGLPALEEALDEEKAPSVDPVLSEAQRILQDYISMLNKGNIVAAGQPADPSVRR